MRLKTLPHLLPKTDPKYQNWLKSLKKRPKPWNKGKNKLNDERIMQMTNTLKTKRIDNLKIWREKMIKSGRIILAPQIMRQSTRAAILIGLVLGDGHIQAFPRTERLTIALNTKYPDLILFSSQLTEKVLCKKPTVEKVKDSSCKRISLYQKHISKRLQIITGNRSKDVIGIPNWIFDKKSYIIGCLKGLFEAEGSLSIHLPTCTYNFQFRNKNKVLLKQVNELLLKLSYHPEVRETSIRLRKRHEVLGFEKLIKFRKYE